MGDWIAVFPEIVVVMDSGMANQRALKKDI